MGIDRLCKYWNNCLNSFRDPYPACAAACVRRDKSRIGSSAEPAWRPLGAQQLSMLISVTRRLSSSPATRAHPRHSAQAIWAGDASWHTCCPHALRPHLSERSRCPPCCTSPARPRWSFRLGSRWFDDARRASSNRVVAARRGRTAWTGEVQQARSDTFRLELSDPANLGLDPATSKAIEVKCNIVPL